MKPQPNKTDKAPEWLVLFTEPEGSIFKNVKSSEVPISPQRLDLGKSKARSARRYGPPPHRLAKPKEVGRIHANSLEMENSNQFCLTRLQVARRLIVSLRTVDAMIRSKAIDVIRIGRSVRISLDALSEFLESRTIKCLK